MCCSKHIRAPAFCFEGLGISLAVHEAIRRSSGGPQSAYQEPHMTQPSEAEVTTSAALGAFFPHPHGDEPIRAELFGAEHLEAHARQLAACAAVAPVVAGQPLLSRFRRNRRALLAAHRRISEAYRRAESFGCDAAWPLDNVHIIADALGGLRTD